MILAQLNYLFFASILLITAGIGAVVYLRLRRSWEEIVVFPHSRALVGKSAEKVVFTEDQLQVMSELHNERVRMQLEQLEIRNKIRALANPSAAGSGAPRNPLSTGENANVQVSERDAQRPPESL